MLSSGLWFHVNRTAIWYVVTSKSYLPVWFWNTIWREGEGGEKTKLSVTMNVASHEKTAAVRVKTEPPQNKKIARKAP